MTFGKRDDGCWHWEYTGSQAKAYSKNLWTIWLCVMLFLYVSLGITAIVKGASQLIIHVLLIIALALGVFVTIVFAMIRFFYRGKTRYVYTANEHVFSPTNGLSSGRYTKLYFDRVKSMTQCRERDAIILKAEALPVEIYANKDDYSAVWNFLRERCPQAEIEEKSV